MSETQATLRIGRNGYDVSDLTEDDSGKGPSMVVHGLSFPTTTGTQGVLVPPNRGVGFSEFVSMHSPPGTAEILTKVWFHFLD